MKLPAVVALVVIGAAVSAFVSTIITDNNTLADCSLRGESHLRDKVYILCAIKRGPNEQPAK